MEFSPSELGIAGGGVVAVALASYKVIGSLIAKRNGNGNNKLKAHDDSSTAHKDIRDDIKTIDGKLDKIKSTGDKILGRLDFMNSRPCQVDMREDGN